MSAVVIINRHTGDIGNDVNDITVENTVANQIDEHQSDAISSSNPIPIPRGIEINYSYWVSTRLTVVTAPANIINNVRWYTNGAVLNTGVLTLVQIANIGNNNGYRQATSAIQLNTTNHTGLIDEPVDASSITYDSPFILSGSISGTGAFSDFIVYQIEVTSSALSGVTASTIFYWAFDET